MSYNGWTNYQTWAVNLWISNEHGAYVQANERVLELFDADVLPGADEIEEATGRAADIIKEIAEDMCEPAISDASLASDLLQVALQDVDWDEIAKSWVSAALEEMGVAA